jgi:hypothetical protein
LAPGEVGVAHWDRARNQPVISRLVFRECPDTHSGDVSRVYVAKRKILLSFSVLAGDSQYC